MFRKKISLKTLPLTTSKKQHIEAVRHYEAQFCLVIEYF